MGLKLGQALEEFQQIGKQIDREMALTNGWLKPRLLLELTGIPAAQLIEKELMKQKREVQK